LFKIKNALQKYLHKLYCSKGLHQTLNLQFVFDDNVRATKAFIKEIFRATEKAHPSPAIPTVMCGGGGEVLALFSTQAVALVMILKQLGLGLTYKSQLQS
jgi:hypothetical protein